MVARQCPNFALLTIAMEPTWRKVFATNIITLGIDMVILYIKNHHGSPNLALLMGAQRPHLPESTFVANII
jgi:hypothetical protein